MTIVGYLIFGIPTSSRDLKKIQNQRTACFGYLEKIQKQRTASFGYFRNFKHPPGFMKEPEKT
jgi:hypothetical protein